MTVTLRKASAEDFAHIFSLFHSILAEGDTFSYLPEDMPETKARAWLMDAPDTHCYVAEHDGAFAGCIAIRPNRAGRGAHVAHGTYMVHPDHRGKGVGRALGEYSLKEAARLGYQAMQFNFVVSTNFVAVKLWASLGFHIVGTIPYAFHHAKLGLVDVHIMHRFL